MSKAPSCQFQIGDTVVDNHKQVFTIVKLVGSGSFGSVYQAMQQSNEAKVCLKIENKTDNNKQILKHEFRVLKQMQGLNGIPKVFGYGTAWDGSCFISMELLGPSLDMLLRYVGKPLAVETVLCLGIRIVRLVENFHSRGYLHRDIKPDNFVMGRSHQARLVHLIDFGLSKRYLLDGVHIGPKGGKSLVGTPRYCSISANAGNEHGRKDDLESVLYMLIYLVRGSLPWQGLKGQTPEEKYANILAIKQSISPEQLCANLPESFCKNLRLCRSLGFSQTPDYKLIRHLFAQDLKLLEQSLSTCKYDWEPSPEKQITAPYPGSSPALVLAEPAAVPRSIYTQKSKPQRPAATAQSSQNGSRKGGSVVPTGRGPTHPNPNPSSGGIDRQLTSTMVKQMNLMQTFARGQNHKQRQMHVPLAQQMSELLWPH